MNIGIIGAGGVSRRHLESYWANGVDVVAVCDPVHTRTVNEVVSGGGRWYETHEEMLSREPLDAVSVCTQPQLHPDICIAALERGLHVLCEKPLANTVADAQRMLGAANDAGRTLMTAFCYRFHPPVVQAKEWVGEGRIGEVRMFRQRFGGYADMRGKWQLDPDKGRGIISESMPHSIDLFHYIVGHAVRFTTTATNHGQGGPGEDMAIITLTTDHGAIGVIEGSWSTPVSLNMLEIYGSEGTIIVDFGIHFDVHSATLYAHGETVRSDFAESGQPPQRFVGLIAHFLDCARAGRLSAVVTPQDSLHAVQVVEWALPPRQQA